MEISDTLDGYEPRDLEKYRPDQSTVLFVEDLYLSQSEYLRNSMLNSCSGPVAVIFDEDDVIKSVNIGHGIPLRRPLSKGHILELLSRMVQSTSTAGICEVSENSSRRVKRTGPTKALQGMNLSLERVEMLQIQMNKLQGALSPAGKIQTLGQYYSLFPLRVLFVDNNEESIKLMNMIVKSVDAKIRMTPKMSQVLICHIFTLRQGSGTCSCKRRKFRYHNPSAIV